VTAAAKTVLLAQEDAARWRWFVAAAVVAGVHAGVIYWLMHKRAWARPERRQRQLRLIFRRWPDRRRRNRLRKQRPGQK
jgi:hypothetical protein